MKNSKKLLFLFFCVALIGIVGVVSLGFYTMEIEDHYGDLQELYYISKSGDIIINRTSSEFGIVEKNWKRINIKTQKTDSTDLYNWVNQNGKRKKIEIYRPKKKNVNLKTISFSELIKLIENSKLKLVLKN